MLRDRPFYGEEGGVTFGGGEFLAPWDAVQVMARLLRAAVHVAVDTSSFVAASIVDAVPNVIDLVLVDLRLLTP